MAKVVLQQNSGKLDNMQFKFKRGSWWFVALTTSALLVVYFILSIGLTFYQRWLLQRYHFPLAVVACHLVIKLCCASVYRQIWQCVYQRKRVVLDCKNHVIKIAPIGFASGLDIGFSNWGIEHVTVSLYVMTKSTSIVFILGFALLFKLEKKSWSIIVIVAMIAGGLGMFTYKASQFDLFGFLLVLFASLSSGLRWTLTQFVMQKSELGLRHPLDMLYTVQPWMLLAVLPLAGIFEGNKLITDFETKNWSAVSHSLSLVVAGAFISAIQRLPSVSASQLISQPPLFPPLLPHSCAVSPISLLSYSVPAEMSAALVLALLLLHGVCAVRVYSGTTRDSAEQEEEGDVPPPPRHHGYHKMPKLSKDAVDKQIDTWHPKMKQNIWELSGLFEGDIMESEMSERNAVLDDSRRWPGGEVPYHISNEFDEGEKAIIRGAMDEYHEKSCVRFRPYRRGDPDYVMIQGDAPGCWSYVGRRDGGQVVNLQGRCVQHGVAIHELLHALGFHHQQSASDRDNFVKIHWENIRPRTRSNFKKYSIFRITDYNVPYDYGSIMHYSSHAFSRNGKPTITPLESGAQIGQRFGLSDADTTKLNIMYGCGSGKDVGRDAQRTSYSQFSHDTSWTPDFNMFWNSPFYY